MLNAQKLYGTKDYNISYNPHYITSLFPSNDAYNNSPHYNIDSDNVIHTELSGQLADDVTLCTAIK